MSAVRHLGCVLLATVVLSASALAANHPAKGASATPPPRSASRGAADEAARALFLRSDVGQARTLAAQALRAHPDKSDARALFVEMEAAALAADTAPLLDAALRLCETRRANDVRANIAAARILEQAQQAGNTPAFRAAVPRIEKLLAAGTPQAPYLRAALLAAAQDGVPGLDPAALARAAGIVTRWRINGPFGKLPNVDWEKTWRPESDAHLAAIYEHKTEDFQFLDGYVALPSYLGGNDGVFYAESVIEIARAAEYSLRLEAGTGATGGAAQLFLDGEPLLTKDDRLATSAAIQHVSLRLTAGSHRLLLKFLADATPLRITLLPSTATTVTPSATVTRRAIQLEVEQRYLRASETYWQGDAAAVVAELPTPANAAEELLLGLALARLSPASGDAPEAAAHFRAALARSPAALAAAYELAAADFAAGRLQDAATEAQRVTALRPDFAPAQELLSEAAERLGWDKLAMKAFENRIALHPSCDTLQKAARLFAKSARYDKARAMEDGLKDCGPQTLAYSDALSERGEHALAAAEAQRLVARAPLDRRALAALEKESHLAGDDAAATAAAAELARLAPNRFVAPVNAAPDFYLPYRRDGLSLAHATAARRFSGGPIVILLNDRAVRLNRDGSADEYVHQLTRVLTKEGIEQYGEAAPPAGAELLELRTIKADGRTFEPELHEHKQTISMPALALEDVIELEYTLHRATNDALAEFPESFHYVLGSFAAPTLYARFAIELPEVAQQQVRITGAESAPLQLGRREGYTARVWEADDIPQSLPEPAMPAAALLPSVTVQPAYASWADVRDHFRELAITAARAGTQVQAAAIQLSRTSETEEETARRIVAYVQKNVQPAAGASDSDAFASGDLASAEDSLANGEGSRTMVALAIAQAAGLDVRLVLAHRASDPAQPGISLGTFTQPLLAFRSRSGMETVADAETAGLAFGALPPSIASGDALSIPLVRQKDSAALLTLRPSAGREENFADADIRLDPTGDAAVRLDIRMGSFRGAQMRTALRERNAAERQQFFEQIALRIFPGAAGVTGTVRHESDSERPLALELRCRVPRLVNLARLAQEDSIDIDQLVPGLGLKRMYAATATRKFALAIDVPLFESATFRLHLPPAVSVAQRARDTRLESPFGDYGLEFRQPDAHTLEVRRSFRVPVQLIDAVAYGAFARFAAQIEDAERQRMTLARATDSTTVTAAGGK